MQVFPTCVSTIVAIALMTLIYPSRVIGQENTIDKGLLAKANSGDANAQNRLSMIYSQMGNSKESCRWGNIAASNGSAEAQFILGEFYQNGSTSCEISKDVSQAMLWYSKAATQGYGSAQDELAFLYFNGEEIPQDYSRAAWWWRKAAEQGIEDAQYNLGYLYFHGEGVTQDYAEAYFWVHIAILGKLETVKPEEATHFRHQIASHLTKTVLSQTQERARKWLKSHSHQTDH
jgi:uncharacterized protein